MTLVKICGLTREEDAAAAVEMGAALIGFVFADSPRRADPGRVKSILRGLRGARSVGVFTEESDDILRLIDDIPLDFAQLHGGQSEEFARRIGPQRVIRAVRVKDERSIEQLPAFACAAAYLLDTYREGKPGGTGEAFDWRLAVRAKEFGVPVALSGGLTPENVESAIYAVRPWAVDVSSGIESAPGQKDHGRMKEFIDNVRRADSDA